MTQLRTSVVVADRCCCPDPAYCHCPDHGADMAASTMQSCGKTSHLVVSKTLPAFDLPPPVAIVAMARAPAPEPPLAPPHAPPEPRRPAAPS